MYNSERENCQLNSGIVFSNNSDFLFYIYWKPFFSQSCHVAKKKNKLYAHDLGFLWQTDIVKSVNSKTQNYLDLQNLKTEYL